MTWRFISSTIIGKSHLDRNEPGQDYHICNIIKKNGSEFFFGLVADGAGSAMRGAMGAKTACEVISSEIEKYIQSHDELDLIPDKDVKFWINTAHDSLNSLAIIEEVPLKDFATTIIGCLIGKKQSIYFQIGDGGIVVNQDNQYKIVFWPEQGDYVNMTYFLSDELYLEHLNIHCTNSSPTEIALFSDGLQNLVLSFSEQSPHPGFFRPLFEYLRNHGDSETNSLSSQLNLFLNRTDISERSDDDKTLILSITS